MTTTIDPFAAGLLLGLIFGASLFVSAQIAIGTVISAGAGILPYVIINGFDAFCVQLDTTVASLVSNHRLAGGLLLGILIAGIFSVIFRRFATWN